MTTCRGEENSPLFLRERNRAMRVLQHFGIILLCAVATSAHGQGKYTNYVAKGGCVLRAQAYKERDYYGLGSPRYSVVSRYDLEIVRMPKTSCQWDYTLDEDPDEHYTNLEGISPVPYGTKKHTILYATLHQYDIYEERVTFKDLNLEPFPARVKQKFYFTPRFLLLKQAVTATTPSGVSLTLPIQGAATPANFNGGGNPDALFIQIHTSPNQREALLPNSPLFKKYGKPVRIKLECTPPNTLVWYRADNTYKTIAIGLPDLAKATHLNALTLIVRQRVDLQSIPVSIRVPISRSVSR